MVRTELLTAGINASLLMMVAGLSLQEIKIEGHRVKKDILAAKVKITKITPFSPFRDRVLRTVFPSFRSHSAGLLFGYTG